MPELEMFGCYANAADHWRTGEVYLVAGRCSTGCHVIQRAILEDELELATFDLLRTHEETIRRAFARKHPDA